MQKGLIKTTLSDKDKVLLNRKGNALFNAGQIVHAERIFLSTGYKDGLVRVGQWYAEHKNFVHALELFRMAQNQRSMQPLVDCAAKVVQLLLRGEAL